MRLSQYIKKNPDLLFNTAAEIATNPQMRDRSIKIIETLATKYHYARAQVELGECYLNGAIVQQNAKTAFKYILQGAEQGDTRGEILLAYAYLKGQGTEVNFKKSFEYFKKVADKNDHNAVYNIAVFYLEGYLGAPDIPQAIAYFKKAAELGNFGALTALGELAQEGFDDNGVLGEPDLHKAFELFKRAAQGDMGAHFNLAFFYEIGFEGQSDPEKAQALYRSILESDSNRILTHKALMYDQGIGTAQDLYKAKEYYEKSIAEGNSSLKKSLDAVNQAIEQEKHETAAQKDAHRVEIPAITSNGSPEEPTVTESAGPSKQKQKKPTAEQVAFGKIKSQEADFKQMLNKKFPRTDGSYVTDVNFRDNIISIERPSDKTVALVSINKATQKRLRNVKTLSYQPRVTEWFTELNNASNLDESAYDSAIRHAFPEMVDVICQLFGAKTAKIDEAGIMRLTFSIPVTLIPGKTKREFKGNVRLGYANSANPVVYHRFVHAH